MTFVGDGEWLVDVSTGRMVVILGNDRIQETNRCISSRDFVRFYALCASVGVPFIYFIAPVAVPFLYFIISVAVP